ncbi:MAG TPA: helix-turn-helix domain-containing protein [Acidimicrobiales bacterium]|nr:helix-turn-helix domain-containing protein [Acidimicrobiales bacterium]
MSRNVARGDATREHLVATATVLFGERGYEGTSVEAVLKAAGTSRGSLYHHFESKSALFEAAFEAVELRVAEEVAAAAGGGTSAKEALRRGGRAWLDLASGDPVVRRIVLVDAPAVLGWARWRELEEESALGLVRAALEVMAAEDRLAPELVDVMAHVLLAAVNEIALFVATAEDPAAAGVTANRSLDELLDRLFPDEAEGGR